MDGVKDYSLSEDGDFVINLIRNDTDKISSLVIALANSEKDIRYVEMLDLDWGGCKNFKSGGNTIIITEDIMKTLPVNTELNIGLYFCFDYDRKSWCGENVTFKVIPYDTFFY